MFFRVAKFKRLLVAEYGENDKQHFVHDSDQGNHFGFALTFALVKSLHMRINSLVVSAGADIGRGYMEQCPAQQSGTALGDLVARALEVTGLLY